ncbi:hypothetical protein B0H13DRAFT_1858735 [Mycena leptocephala]|nr:hypothetical protein B0H13DRAFT_1858735 [Mycena leptocephala]
MLSQEKTAHLRLPNYPIRQHASSLKPQDPPNRKYRGDSHETSASRNFLDAGKGLLHLGNDGMRCIQEQLLCRKKACRLAQKIRLLRYGVVEKDRGPSSRENEANARLSGRQTAGLVINAELRNERTVVQARRNLCLETKPGDVPPMQSHKSRAAPCTCANTGMSTKWLRAFKAMQAASIHGRRVAIREAGGEEKLRGRMRAILRRFEGATSRALCEWARPSKSYFLSKLRGREIDETPLAAVNWFGTTDMNSSQRLHKLKSSATVTHEEQDIRFDKTPGKLWRLILANFSPFLVRSVRVGSTLTRRKKWGAISIAARYLFLS